MNTPKIASSSNTTALESYSIAQAQQPTDWQNTEAAASGLSAFGTAKPDFALLMVSVIVNTACEENPANRSQPHNIFEAMAALTGIGPRDEIEAMLATQMVATHVAAIKALKQLKGSVNTTQQDSNGNLAVKLLRTFTMQLEALQRYRGKGQQKVTVEHVHVNAGGQAIVGIVHPPATKKSNGPM